MGGVPIAQGTMVLISPYTTHRHAEFWDEPERFNPARFVDLDARKRPLYAFAPFAGGRHLCLGQRFATIEGQIITAMILARYEFHAVPDAPLSRIYNSGATALFQSAHF